MTKIPPEAPSGTRPITQNGNAKAPAGLPSWTCQYIDEGRVLTNADVPAATWFEARERFGHVVSLDPYDRRIRATRRTQ